MKELVFATTNQGKVATLQAYLDGLDCNVAVVARPLAITEIQADTALEVAHAKASEAYDQLQHPLVVDDSEMCIEALGGFPGPYQKYMTEKLGPEGFVRLMQGYDNRRAYFISNLIFVDDNGDHHAFSDDPYRGSIADTVDTTERPNAWGPLWKVFIPEGLTKTVSRLTAEEKHAYDDGRTAVDAYKKFALWFKDRYCA